MDKQDTIHRTRNGRIVKVTPEDLRWAHAICWHHVGLPIDHNADIDAEV